MLQRVESTTYYKCAKKRPTDGLSFDSFPVVNINKHNELNSILREALSGSDIYRSLPEIFDFSKIKSASCMSVKCVDDFESIPSVNIEFYDNTREMLKFLLADEIVRNRGHLYLTKSIVNYCPFFRYLYAILDEDKAGQVKSLLDLIITSFFTVKGVESVDILGAINILEHQDVRGHLFKLVDVIEIYRLDLPIAMAGSLAEFVKMYQDNTVYLSLFTKSLQISVGVGFSGVFGSSRMSIESLGMFNINSVSDNIFVGQPRSQFSKLDKILARAKYYAPFFSTKEFYENLSMATLPYVDYLELDDRNLKILAIGVLIQKALKERDYISGDVYGYLLNSF